MWYPSRVSAWQAGWSDLGYREHIEYKRRTSVSGYPGSRGGILLEKRESSRYEGNYKSVQNRSIGGMSPSELDTELQSENELHELKASSSTPKLDPGNARFPCCIVWTPLPVVAWLAPFVGHVGICREDGVILDFAGPFFVNVDNFAFGSTARYVRLNLEQCCFPAHLSAHTCKDGFGHANVGGTGISWDDALRGGMHNYQHKSYNLFTCNCHSFVAGCLNRLAYKGSHHWNIIDVAAILLLRGQWVDFKAVIRSFAWFVVVMTVGLCIAGWPFFVGWAAFSVLLLAWFLVATYFMKEVIHC